jgi:hypothetical protein
MAMSENRFIPTRRSRSLSITFAAPAGSFTGTATIRGTAKAISFKGAVHQKQQRASGFSWEPIRLGASLWSSSQLVQAQDAIESARVRRQGVSGRGRDIHG